MKKLLILAIGLLSGCAPPLIVVFGGSMAGGGKSEEKHENTIQILEGDHFVPYKTQDREGVEIGLNDEIGPFYLVKVYASGTPITCPPGTDECISQKYLDELKEGIRFATTYLNQPVKKIIWMKGFGTKPEIQGLRDELEAEFGKMEWVAGLVSENGSEGREETRQALEDIADCTVDMNGYETVDGLHLTEDEYINLGKEMAKECL